MEVYMEGAWNELHMYKDFDELAKDILEMAKEFMPEQLVYLTTFTNEHQVILKLSEEYPAIQLHEGMVIQLGGTVCNRIDFENNKPLIYENMNQEASLDDIRKTLVEANINSYLGIPVILASGKPFGTICAVHQEPKIFNVNSIRMLQRIAKMFSFYLDLERMAYRDSLTGLYNRQFLYEHFESVNPAEGALFFLDLDGFKKINDIHGHDTGDFILKEVARKLESTTKHLKGFAVRLGGDEFIVHLEGGLTIEEYSKLAENILIQLSTWDTHLEEFHLSVSIGIATYQDGKNNQLPTLLKNADDALYKMKAKGKNGYHFFNKEAVSFDRGSVKDQC
jgi:diguanylate cyclase (GGDEF)-like protein